MPGRFETIAAELAKIRAEYDTLKGSRDYQDRARRIALRVAYREAKDQLRDAANDIKITIATDFRKPTKRSDC